MNQPMPYPRGADHPTAGLLRFLSQDTEVGLGQEPLPELPVSTDRGGGEDERREAKVVLEAFIPPDTHYRTPFPFSHEDMREIIANAECGMRSAECGID